MLPAQNTPLIPNQSRPVELLPARTQSSVGPLVGAVIIIVLLGFGALYFWGAFLNRQDSIDPLPFIPSEPESSLQ